jgi:hypothetical protein
LDVLFASIAVFATAREFAVVCTQGFVVWCVVASGGDCFFYGYAVGLVVEFEV